MQTRGYRYTPTGISVLSQNPEEVNPEDKTIQVQLKLRGKSIGTIALKRKSNTATWTDVEREMVERVAIQAALALENARLLEESQRQALREQTVNEFSSRFSHSLDVDTLLQHAVRELHRLPQVADVAIFINPAEEAETPE